MAGGSYCPKCEGRMAEGFIADQGHGSYYVPSWHPEAPDKRWWGLKLDKKKFRPIATFRCTKCGFLESYAK